jgi:regulator of replication initiation timing
MGKGNKVKGEIVMNLKELESLQEQKSQLVEENRRLVEEIKELKEKASLTDIFARKYDRVNSMWQEFDEKIKQMFVDNFHLGESRITISDYFQLQMDMGIIEWNPDRSVEYDQEEN